MARIRTVKPAFLRHEKLQDLEHENPGQYIMIVFMGLWMLADSKGRFEYKPRSMKLDILPFLDYNMQQSLDVLEKNGFIRSYEVNGCRYGVVPTFRDHQRITGKELTEGEKFPPEPEHIGIEPMNNIREALVKQLEVQEGNGKEEELKEEGESTLEYTPPIDLNLSAKLMKYFGFNEVANFDKLRQIAAFLRCLQASDRLVYFEEQFAAYIEFKGINDSFRHSFKNFLGTTDQFFENGAWNAENWTEKLVKEQQQIIKTREQSGTGKGVEAAMEWRHVERRTKQL